MKQVAVITAASRGIGAATALAFGKAGYDVVVNYRTNKIAADKIVDKVNKSGSNAIAIQADVFTEAGVKNLFKEIQKTYKTINILVNNAGIADEPDFEGLTLDTIIESLSGNFISAVLCTQAAVPIMKKGSSILFVSSIYGLNYGGATGLPLYSAAKAGIINFAQTMADRLAPDIRCNVVAPGVTKTDAWDGVDPNYIKMRLSQALQPEWVQPSEIADALVFLAKTPHTNASTVVVDGGWLKKFPPRN
jgi:3-oxoacyl-[acyl-carrier protein] reductase